MKLKLTSLVVLLAAACMLSSCLNSDDDTTEYNYSKDTAISAFTLGTLNRYLHTTSSTGADSIYKTTVTGSYYKMVIDQLGRQIYNTDSLPYGTDAKHVLATITAVNNGIILVKNVDSDSLRYYSSTDSIDFSTPRTVRIVSQDGQRYADYTVTLNVRKVPVGTVDWSLKTTSTELAQLAETRALAADGKVFVFGRYKGHTVGYKTLSSDGAAWTLLAQTFSEKASVIAKDNILYALDEGKLMASTDGDKWTTVAVNGSLKSLVAASTKHLYALKADANGKVAGMMVSADNGVTWTDDTLDDDASLLPDEGTAYSCTSTHANKDIDQVVLVGRCSAANDIKARVWTRLDDYSTSPVETTWSYVENSGKDLYALGSIQALAVTAYEGVPYALKSDGSEVSALLCSLDGGLSWKDSGLTVPSGMTATNGNLAMTVDKDGRMWIIADGKVWKN